MFLVDAMEVAANVSLIAAPCMAIAFAKIVFIFQATTWVCRNFVWRVEGVPRSTNQSTSSLMVLSSIFA